MLQFELCPETEGVVRSPKGASLKGRKHSRREHRSEEGSIIHRELHSEAINILEREHCSEEGCISHKEHHSEAENIPEREHHLDAGSIPEMEHRSEGVNHSPEGVSLGRGKHSSQGALL
ncbi:unnamed protein product [Linum trigynum]|uniref:Uncharacterized protein n=1 Tax=Linum trigynum TaxID=586398 RepID=A0AAV2FV35_9ROSI